MLAIGTLDRKASGPILAIGTLDRKVSGPILAIGTLDRKAGRTTGHQQTNKTRLRQTGVEVSRQKGREGEQGDRFTDRH